MLAKNQGMYGQVGMDGHGNRMVGMVFHEIRRFLNISEFWMCYIYFLYCYFVPLFTVALYYSPILYILYHSIAILQDCKNANYGYYYTRCFPLITLYHCYLLLYY